MLEIPAKFKLAWHYALGGRDVFVRIWTGVAAVDGPGGRGTAGRQWRILKTRSHLARRRCARASRRLGSGCAPVAGDRDRAKARFSPARGRLWWGGSCIYYGMA